MRLWCFSRIIDVKRMGKPTLVLAEVIKVSFKLV